ncbi:hypothetical protein BAUCODRAFT_124245 [Baudoinia panamericana UAMH 10762]|uniref:Uncharacterized protein n=1 Tax=Baudoinia panamericana (strain UAMH 10762) TaxID=717646 RepID=M2MSZ1_BAUPA|nr:uncharacterized protein BAUCODRAFT_124245 [Baudoinia panamericana UAMH 10762]EMC94633.1 hypothetical protein BAUCODRAFT_124245 [Baudoinia panamericana UAMH 10762]
MRRLSSDATVVIECDYCRSRHQQFWSASALVEQPSTSSLRWRGRRTDATGCRSSALAVTAWDGWTLNPHRVLAFANLLARVAELRRVSPVRALQTATCRMWLRV